MLFDPLFCRVAWRAYTVAQTDDCEFKLIFDVIICCYELLKVRQTTDPDGVFGIVVTVVTHKEARVQFIAFVLVNHHFRELIARDTILIPHIGKGLGGGCPVVMSARKKKVSYSKMGLESVESLIDHHTSLLSPHQNPEVRLNGNSDVVKLKHIAKYLGNRIPATNLNQMVAYLIDDNEMTPETIHLKMTDMLKNERSNETIEFENNPIIEGTGVDKGRYVVSDVNQQGFRSVVAFLHAINRLSLSRRLARGFGGLPAHIPVISVELANHITDISSAGKYCRAYADSEGDCRALKSHCRWARNASGETNCVPKSRRTRSAMGTGDQQSVKKWQRDLPGMGQRLQRPEPVVSGWYRPTS